MNRTLIFSSTWALFLLFNNFATAQVAISHDEQDPPYIEDVFSPLVAQCTDNEIAGESNCAPSPCPPPADQERKLIHSQGQVEIYLEVRDGNLIKTWVTERSYLPEKVYSEELGEELEKRDIWNTEEQDISKWQAVICDYIPWRKSIEDYRYHESYYLDENGNASPDLAETYTNINRHTFSPWQNSTYDLRVSTTDLNRYRRDQQILLTSFFDMELEKTLTGTKHSAEALTEIYHCYDPDTRNYVEVEIIRGGQGTREERPCNTVSANMRDPLLPPAK